VPVKLHQLQAVLFVLATAAAALVLLIGETLSLLE
jgi:hypothetical protein